MIELLYSSVGIIVGAGYLPQITKLLLTTRPCHEISAASWLIWAYTSSVSLLYSLYGQEILDTKFITVNLVNVICICFVISIIAYKRRKYGKTIPAIIQPLQSDIEEIA
ncbi:MAG: hypothetical protein KAJ29_05885 [Alphaproteobacteria bacterium]|nr:hypothetical protein [Alphaproteobacteria bacterium]